MSSAYGWMLVRAVVDTRRTVLTQSGVPFFYPSIEPKVGFERREAALPSYEREAQWHVELAPLPEADCTMNRPHVDSPFLDSQLHLPVQLTNPTVRHRGVGDAAGLAG